MLDDFFQRALLAGIGLAIVAGPLGCVIVWRRLAYFGDTLAHSALLGVAIGFILQIDITLAVFANAIVIGVMLLMLQRQTTIPPDALLGLLSHGSLALGLVALAASKVRVDLMALLFGDILAVSRSDLAVVFGGGAIILALLARIWTSLFAATVSEDIAAAEGLAPERSRLVFVLLVATAVAIAMKLVGIMLITALLIIPAVTARQFADGPERMALVAALAGVASVAAGLSGSLQWDTPAGPSVVVAATAFFAASLCVAAMRAALQSTGREDRP